MKNIRNIGIFAHVDAGKTTLSEQLLLKCGMVRTIGSVDSGTAHTDTLPVERRRGISVKAKSVSLNYNDTLINLIDTPGHADFAAEVERSIWALDGAVIIVCAVEGVAAHTRLIYNALKEQDIPTLFFINKIDRMGADKERVLKEIQNLTSSAAFLDDKDALCEIISENDDDFMERYLSGEKFSTKEINEKIKNIKDFSPVVYGSALNGIGIDEVLDAIVEFLPMPNEEEKLCGVCFASETDKNLGRGLFVRLYGGSLQNRESVKISEGEDIISGEEKFSEYKITQIFNLSGQPVGKLSCGEIGLVFGLSNVKIGEVLGDKEVLKRNVTLGKLKAPLIRVKVTPENSEDITKLSAAFNVLSGEDPLLNYEYIKNKNEIVIEVMGKIQLEIISELLETSFDIKASFSDPSVIYKETIREAAEGFVAYTMPKPCWAILKFLIEPAKRGSGVTYESKVAPKNIPLRYQHQVKQAIPLALSQGRLGHEVTDVKITLIDGGDHHIHTHPLDFIVATPMAIQDGLNIGGSILLEPIVKVQFILPPQYVGRVLSDVALMRGEVIDTQSENESAVVSALIPAKECIDYPTQVASFTSGEGVMTMALDSYRECPLELGEIEERRSVDPLDKSKYILAARSALEGGIFNF